MPDSQALDLELALDRVFGQLDGELAAHARAFARAHAAGQAAPAAPDLASRASTAAIGKRAIAFPDLRARGAALLRIVAPLVIERDAAVVAARSAPPTWDAWRTLGEARDAAARARFGRRHVEVLHRLAGCEASASWGADPETLASPPLPGWTEPDGQAGDVAAAWAVLADGVGIPRAGLDLIASDVARPRTFVVTRGAAAIAVVPRVIDTPARRFAVLHELGHAALALASRHEWPRALDEAGAAYVARMMEVAPGAAALPPGWESALAAPARARRREIARALAGVEDTREVPAAAPPRPPWALWHDAGAQRAYAAAEDLADALAAELGPPRPGRAFVDALLARAAHVDENFVP